jgi:hypothetical protein
MVVGGKLKLVDFYFAVDSENYREYNYIENDISQISDLGEEFSEGKFEWNDSKSVAKVIEFLGGGISNQALFSAKNQTISPSVKTFSKNIIRQRDENIVLRHAQEILQNEITNKDKHINELHEEIRKRDGVLESIAQSKSYRAVEKIKRYSGIIKRGKNEE